MLTSAARETLRGVETLILDEVHAVAGTQARRPPRALGRAARAARRRARPADRPLGDPAAARGDRHVRLRRPADRARRRRHAQGARPAGRRPGRRPARARLDREPLAAAARRRRRRPTADASTARARSGRRCTRELLELVEEHRSTIVFVNNRRLAERLALRLNELAEREIARAHHGSLAREQRRDRRGRPEGGPHPVPRRHLVARARHRHGRRRPRDPGRVAEVGRPRPAARSAAPATSSAPSRRAGSSRSSAPTCSSRAVVARAMREGEIEETQIPRNPLDVLAQQIVAICVDEEISVDELHALVAPRLPVRRPLAARSSRTCSTCSPGRYPSDEFAELRPRIVWDRTRRHDPRARRRAPARGHERRHDPRPRPLRRLPRRRRRPGRRARRGDGLRGAGGPDVPARRLDLADRGDHARPRARLAGARACPGAVPFWKGEGVGRPYELGREDRRRLARALGARRRDGARRGSATSTSSTSARRATCSRSCATRRDATGAVPVRPHDRRRALPRRDRRLARLHPHPVRRPRARAVGDGDRGAAARVARARRAVDLVGRRDRAPLPRRRRAAAGRRAAARPGRGRGSRRRRARRDGALRRALPRERRARAADPAPPAGPAHAALAAAAEGAVAAPGRAQVRLVPDRPRDLPRVPAGRLRPARRCGACCRACQTRRLDLVEVETRSASPYQLVAPLRLRRDLHVRGRHAAGRAPGAGALARPRPAARAARQEELRDLLDARRRRGGRAAAAAATPRTPDELHDQLRIRGDRRAGEYDPALAEPLLARAARGARAPRGRGAADRRRGRGPLPRRARRDAARRACPTRSSRAAPTRSGSSCCATRKGRGPFTTGAGERARSAATSTPSSPSSSAGSCSCAASSGRAAPSASGATPTSCAGCGARRSRRCGARSSRSSRRRSRGSCRRGTGSTGARRCARRSCRCRRSRCRSRSGSASCCRGASPATGPSSSTRSARAARSSGSAPASTASRSTSARTRPRSARSPAAPPPEGEVHDATPRRARRGALFWDDLLDETRLDDGEALPALWDLVWAGEVTNDAWTPLRAGAPQRRAEAGAAAAPLLARAAPARPATQGAGR